MGVTTNVQPADVSAAGAKVSSAASGVSGAAGSVAATGVNAKGFTTPEALTAYCQAWAVTLRSFASTCTSAGGALVSNANTYNVQESTIAGHLRELD